MNNQLQKKIVKKTNRPLQKTNEQILNMNETEINLKKIDEKCKKKIINSSDIRCFLLENKRAKKRTLKGNESHRIYK